MLKLKRNGGGGYDTLDGAYRIAPFKTSAWINANEGTRHYTSWTAISLTETANGFPVRVARGDSLKALRATLARYLKDRAAGTLKEPHTYGVWGIR